MSIVNPIEDFRADPRPHVPAASVATLMKKIRAHSARDLLEQNTLRVFDLEFERLNVFRSPDGRKYLLLRRRMLSGGEIYPPLRDILSDDHDFANPGLRDARAEALRYFDRLTTAEDRRETCVKAVRAETNRLFQLTGRIDQETKNCTAEFGFGDTDRMADHLARAASLQRLEQLVKEVALPKLKADLAEAEKNLAAVTAAVAA